MERKISANHTLSLMNFAEEDDYIYFVDEIWNCVYKMRKSDYSRELIGFDKSNYGRSNVYKWIAKKEGKIVLVPLGAKDALCIITKEGLKHSGSTLFELCGDKSVSNCVQHNQYLYIFMNDSRFSIIIYDIDVDEFSLGFSWSKFIVENRGLEKCKWWPGRIIIKNDRLMFPLRDTNQFAEYDTKTGKFKLTCMYKGWCFSYAIRQDGDLIWAMELGGDRLLKIKILEKGFEMLSVINIESCFGDEKYNDFEIDLPYIYFLNEEIVQLDIETMETVKMQFPDNFRWIKDRRYQSGVRFTATSRDEEYLNLFPRTGNGILCIGRKTREMKCIPLVENMKQIYKDLRKNANLVGIREWDGDIEGLIDIVRQRGKLELEIKMDIGNMIWNIAKRDG